MATSVTTRDGDVLDQVAFSAYGGYVQGATEAMLAANRGLEGYGPILPAGLALTLPDVAPATATPQVSLWD